MWVDIYRAWVEEVVPSFCVTSTLRTDGVQVLLVLLFPRYFLLPRLFQLQSHDEAVTWLLSCDFLKKPTGFVWTRPLLLGTGRFGEVTTGVCSSVRGGPGGAWPELRGPPCATNQKQPFPGLEFWKHFGLLSREVNFLTLSAEHIWPFFLLLFG